MEDIKIKDALKLSYENKDSDMLNSLFDDIEQNDNNKEYVYFLLSENEKWLYYVLQNRNKANDFLLKLKDLFKETKWKKKFDNVMHHPDTNVRLYMINEISKAKTDIFLEWYIEWMKDENWEIKRNIANVLAKHNTDETLSILVSFLDDSDRRVVKETIVLLSDKGESVFPYIEKYMDLPMVRLKLNILELLNKIESVKKLKYLLMLSRDAKEKVKIEAQQSIFFFLEKIEVTEMNGTAEQVLEYLAEELKKNDLRKLALIIKMLMKFKEKGIEKIILDLEENWNIKDNYIRLLEEIKTKEKIYLIIGLLNSKLPNMKNVGLRLLNNFKIKKDYENEIEHILGEYILENINTITAKERSSIVSFIITNNMLERNIKKLNSDDSKERNLAIEIIGLIGEPRIYKLLINMRKDPEAQVRRSILRVLAAQKDENFLAVFKEMLEDPEEYIQREAIEAIAILKSPDAKTALYNAMNHPNKYIRAYVSKMLAKETIVKYIASFDKLDEANKKKVASMLEKMDTDMEEILLKKVKSIDVNERRRTVNILEYVENRLQYKRVILAAMRDPEAKIRASITAILINVNDKEILVAMLKLLNDPDRRVRANIIEAFGKIKNKTAVKLLLPYINDNDNRIKANSIIALYFMGYKETMHKVDEMLASKSDNMRASGIYVIKKLRLTEKIEKMNNMIEDKSQLVKINLIKAFYKFGETNKLRLLLQDSDSEVAKTAKEYLDKGM